MARKILYLMVFTVALPLMSAITEAAETMSRTEQYTVSAAGVRAVEFNEIVFTDLTYRGIEGADEFSVSLERSVKTDDESEFEEIMSRIDLDIVDSGGKISLTLIHPKETTKGFINRVFDRKEWRVKLDITGPRDADLDIDADLSSIRTSDTRGAMKIRADFTDTTVRSHSGKIVSNTSFSGFDCEDIDGAFDIETSFGEVYLKVAHLDGDSRADVSFGSIDLRLPRNAGAEFNVSKSMGNVNFRTSGPLTTEGYKGSRRVLGDGGPRVDLNVEFGDITVHNNLVEDRRTSEYTSRSGDVIPLGRGVSWRLTSGTRTMTVSVEKPRSTREGRSATLRFEIDGDKVSTRNVIEKKDGLYLSSIDGDFFGRQLSGVRFDPPQLWLPYDQDAEMIKNYILGTIRVSSLESLETPSDTLDNLLEYNIDYPDGTSHIVTVAPGIGFAALGSFRLESYNLGSEARRPQRSTPPPPKPKFEKGVVATIDIRGTDILTDSDVLDILDIKKGGTYTREEITKAVQTLDDKNKFIAYANFSIDLDGHLVVRIHEVDIHKRDFDVEGSFNRIGGIGIGPKLTITSMLGPISEISGGAQYHFANKEWTYHAGFEKRFFTKTQLAIGGTYRLDYESNMDWAIPKDDSNLNAFLLGLETKHYHQVEGATGYVSLSRGSLAKITAEYFEEEFDSLKKHTNWSVGNHRHVKDDNPPLAPMDVGRLVGFRLRGVFRHASTLTNTGLMVEAEQALDKSHNTVGDYTRLFANAVNTWKLSRENYFKIRLAGGYSNDYLPAHKAFNLGGINTLRGFDYQSIPGDFPFPFLYGGNRMALCNVEYMIGKDNDVGLIVFADAGQVWVKNRDVDFKDLKRDIGVSLAFDLNFFSADEDDIPMLESDIDGLRINWAVPVGNEPHVSMWTVNFVRAF